MDDAIGGTDGLMGSCALGTEKGFIGRDCAKLIELAQHPRKE